MATYIYGDWETPSGYGFQFRSFFAYTTSSTNTTYSVTLFAGAQIRNNTGTVKMSLSCNVSGTGKTAKSKTVTFDTGSDDSSGRQTFISSWTWTWDKSTSSASKTITCTINRSSMTASSCSKSFTVPALSSYTVSYNVNGGSGTTPSSQKKYYGKALTLNNGSGLQRTNHSLLGWNTSAAGTGTSYNLGGSYTSNSAVTLYANWHLDYIKPSISNINIYRVNSSSSSVETDDGEYIRVQFDYVGGTVDGGTTRINPTCEILIDGTQVYSSVLTSGFLPANYGTYSKDSSHTVSIKLYDSNDTTGVSVSRTVSTATYPIDLIGNGDDVYMGIMTPAEIGIPLNIGGNLTVDRQGNVEAAGEIRGATSKRVITTFSSGWDVYSTDPAAPITLRRCGKFVDLTGMIRNTTAVTLNATQVTIFTIPEGYRPSQTMTMLSQGSSMNVFVIRIKASGDVTFERYRSTNSTSTSYSSISEGAWFPIHAAWIMD